MSSYSYTGTIQHFTVGTQGGNYSITAYGGSGYQGGSFYAGGKGAETGGLFNLNPNEKLRLIVGGAGHGGGALGGGGGSFVLGSTDGGASYQLLLVAGGGGGAAFEVPGHGGYAASSGKGSGEGGAGGTYKYANGGGGAGFKSGGTNGQGPFSGAGGSTYSGAGGLGYFNSNGGFGGGGAGGQFGGGGGGGYTGGAGGQGYNQFPTNAANSGHGGTSFDAGTPIAASTLAAVHAGNGSITINTVCFVEGTQIRTARGDVAVEALQAGDLAVTASGHQHPIRWLSHRTADCRNHPRPQEVLPVCIAAHAFGDNRPARDLFLSPGHPVLVGAEEDGSDGHLVPIMCLVNGTTIERVEVDEVTYWHVELDQHDILLAEGLPAESYIDLGSRLWFAGADGAHYDPDMALSGMPGRCRPVAIDGPVVEAERRRLDQVFATQVASAAAWPDVQNELLALF